MLPAPDLPNQLVRRRDAERTAAAPPGDLVHFPNKVEKDGGAEPTCKSLGHKAKNGGAKHKQHNSSHRRTQAFWQRLFLWLGVFRREPQQPALARQNDGLPHCLPYRSR